MENMSKELMKESMKKYCEKTFYCFDCPFFRKKECYENMENIENENEIRDAYELYLKMDRYSIKKNFELLVYFLEPNSDNIIDVISSIDGVEFVQKLYDIEGYIENNHCSLFALDVKYKETSFRILLYFSVKNKNLIYCQV